MRWAAPLHERAVFCVCFPSLARLMDATSPAHKRSPWPKTSSLLTRKFKKGTFRIISIKLNVPFRRALLESCANIHDQHKSILMTVAVIGLVVDISRWFSDRLTVQRLSPDRGILIGCKRFICLQGAAYVWLVGKHFSLNPVAQLGLMASRLNFSIIRRRSRVDCNSEQQALAADNLRGIVFT